MKRPWTCKFWSGLTLYCLRWWVQRKRERNKDWKRLKKETEVYFTYVILVHSFHPGVEDMSDWQNETRGWVLLLPAIDLYLPHTCQKKWISGVASGIFTWKNRAVTVGLWSRSWDHFNWNKSQKSKSHSKNSSLIPSHQISTQTLVLRFRLQLVASSSVFV